VHQERAARVVDLLARAEIDMLQRGNEVEHPAHVHLETKRAQQAAEDEEIAK
jgi:hypothetical protein